MNIEANERVEEARFILEGLGFDAERSNERSALVLWPSSNLLRPTTGLTLRRPCREPRR